MKLKHFVYFPLLFCFFILFSCSKESKKNISQRKNIEVVFPENLSDSLNTEYKAFSEVHGDTAQLNFLLRIAFELLLQKKQHLHVQLIRHILTMHFDSLTLPVKFEAQIKMARYHQFTMPDSSIYFLKLGIEEASSKRYLTQLGSLYREMASLYLNHSNAVDAIEYFNFAINTMKAAGNDKLRYHYITELGSAYQSVKQDAKALDCYLQGKAFAERNRNYDLLVYSLNSLGDLFRMKGNIDTALYFHKRAMEAYEHCSSFPDMWACTSLGKLYGMKGDFATAKQYFNVVLNAAETNFQPSLITQAYLNLAHCEFKSGNSGGAIELAQKAYNLSRVHYDLTVQAAAARKLSTIYEALGQFPKSLEFYKYYKAAEDSISNNIQMKKVAAAEFKQKENKLLAALEQNKERFMAAQEKQRMERKKLQIIIFSVTFGLILILTFTVFIYRSLQRNRKQNQIIQRQKQQVEEQKYLIEEQKRTVEEKNKEVLDSIQYARRIQHALMPTEKYIEKKLKRV
jgi:tetratricopeptide (TPR) repeat protein